MEKALPWQLNSVLTEDRLNTIARAFLDVYYKVEEQLHTDDDCNYTRGASFFGRSRNRLIAMAQSADTPWLSLSNGGMDVTCEFQVFRFDFSVMTMTRPKREAFGVEMLRTNCLRLTMLPR